jgi:hypothetical protein
MINLAEYLLREFKEETLEKSVKFFRSHGGYGYVIWLTLLLKYFKKETLPIEELVLSSEKYASRRTVVDFINKSSEGGVLVKIISDADRRKVFIEPSTLTISEYSYWTAKFIDNVK